MSSFPENDICPNVCGKNIGAFKMSQENPNTGVVKTAPDNPKMPQNVLHDSQDLNEADSRPRALTASTRASDFQPGPDGKVDWTPLAEKTGTRPVVDKYGLSRYSLNEWRNHNNSVLNTDVITNANIIDYNAKTSIMKAIGTVDKNQQDNLNRLKQKAREGFRWKAEVQQACVAITDEVEKLQAEKQRMKAAFRTLMLPQAISKECLEIRTNRIGKDHVSDLAEQELVTEMNMVNEIRDTFTKALEEIDSQLEINKAAKQRIEYDYCDKEMAYNTDTMNVGLDIKSNILMFKPGSVRFGQQSAPITYWEYFCRENIQNCETARQKSIDLRESLQSILVISGRKLRTQADKTDVALAETVAISQEICTKLETTLRDTLQKIADTERLIDHLSQTIRNMDSSMKLAQTRLDNRNNGRQHGEQVRDQVHLGLINEAGKIHDTVTALLFQLKGANGVRKDLISKRRELELEIASKRKCLMTDRDRLGMVRSHYPNALELAGQ